MKAFIPTSLYGIIGYPINHSLSPLMHNTAFQAAGIPGALLLWNVKPENLGALIDAFRLLDVRGSCVGIPHKAPIVAHLDEVTERVKMSGACNTIYRDGDKICGENTDILGFMHLLEQNPPDKNAKVLMLGAGGAGRAVVCGLHLLGLKNITLCDVAPANAETLAAEFDLKLTAWEKRAEIEADLIINVTPLGMAGKFRNETAYTCAQFAAQGKTGIAYDVVYTPEVTRFHREAEQAGWKAVGGQSMFFAQGSAQFRLWTGRDMPAEAFEAVRAKLAEQASV